MFKLPMVAGIVVLAAFPLDNENVIASSRFNEQQPASNLEGNIGSLIENVGYILAAIDTYSYVCDHRNDVASEKYLKTTYYSLLSTYDWGDFVRSRDNQLDGRTKEGVFFNLVKDSYLQNMKVMKANITEGCEHLLKSANESSNMISEIKKEAKKEDKGSPFKDFVKNNFIVKNAATFSAALPRISLPLTLESINTTFPTDESLEEYVNLANEVHDASLQTLMITKIYYEAFKYPRDSSARNMVIEKLLDQQPKYVESILTPISTAYTEKFFNSKDCYQMLGDYCTLGLKGGIIPVSSSPTGTKYIVLQTSK